MFLDKIKIKMPYSICEREETITSAVVKLAKNTGLNKVIESSELDQQIEFMNMKVCDEIQGFYYGHPLPAEGIMEILKNGVKKNINQMQ